MFNKIKIDDLNENWVKKIHYEWALIVTNDTDKVNAMTANWLQMGYLWNKNVVTVYVRPERHTYNTMENSEFFSVAFFNPEHKKNLMFLHQVFFFINFKVRRYIIYKIYFLCYTKFI